MREIITVQVRITYKHSPNDRDGPVSPDRSLHLRRDSRQVGQCGNQIGCRFWELALKDTLRTTQRRDTTTPEQFLSER